MLSTRVNQVKREIDDLTAKVNDKRAMSGTASVGDEDRKPDAVVIDEEEFALLRQLKDKKKLYQQTFHDRKMVENELSYLKGLVSQTKVRLCNDFLAWYQATYHVAASNESLAAVTLAMAESDDAVDRKEAAKDGGEKLDDGEQFEKMMREKIINDDPESLSYLTAVKTAAAAAKKKKAPGAKH